MIKWFYVLLATGSVVRSSKYETGKGIYYYAGVVHFKGKIVPICELVTSKHDTATLTCFFFSSILNISLQYHSNDSDQYLHIEFLIWSFANIMTLCRGLNDITHFAYLNILNVIYKYVSNTINPNNVGTAQLDYYSYIFAHFMHTVSRALKRIDVKKDTKTLY